MKRRKSRVNCRCAWGKVVARVLRTADSMAGENVAASCPLHSQQEKREKVTLQGRGSLSVCVYKNSSLELDSVEQ